MLQVLMCITCPQIGLRAGPQLVKITLGHSPAVTDSGLVNLAARAPALRHLALRALPAVTGASLPAIAASCSSLQTLELQVRPSSRLLSVCYLPLVKTINAS